MDWLTWARGLLRGGAPPSETTVLARDMSMAVAMAAMVAAETVVEQKEAFERQIGRAGIGDDDDDGGPGDYYPVRALRFATDDFVVGYSVGLATRSLLMNGRQSHEIPMRILLSKLQARLKEVYPDLNFESTYRRGSKALACGILFGMHEQGENLTAIEFVLSLMSPHALGPEIALVQFAYVQCGLSFAEGELARDACLEMLARYARHAA